MNYWHILLIIGLIIIGIGLWYYFTTYQTNPLGITLGGLIPSILGAYKLYIPWKATPTLEFGSISHNDEPAYFITVKKKKGKGAVKKCEGKITIEDIYTNTVWALNEPRQIDIVDKMPLRLFYLEREKNVIDFPSAALVQGRASNPKPLDKFIDKKLTIKVFSETHNPKSYTKTIREIIKLGNTN